jgi:hypothetical protein
MKPLRNDFEVSGIPKENLTDGELFVERIQKLRDLGSLPDIRTLNFGEQYLLSLNLVQ